jgi:lipopolysaccharide export LptBFGC system permease protein LptF
MSHCPKCKQDIPFLVDKKTLLMYSLYLAVGSVSLFIALNSLNTAYQAYIWSYSTKYVLNSLALALILLIASGILLFACYRIAKGKTSITALGAMGCLILLVYPIYVILIDSYVPYTFTYMLLLWVPAMIVLAVGLFIWNKQKKNG